ncbi:hypothetical protein VNI00_002890 [Paramarasmius palmivorus]|uniref:Peptidase C19 ubiquitin carboxyl-terminal hydrolase domain-containing protein n=1 Tax=Paramarasmius palmivorus TaxID=297713 RepID=A0AAW0DYH4_9AGAR
MTHLTPPTDSESEKVALLSGMMGDAVDTIVALRVLRKFGGSVEKAADAMLGGDRGVEEAPPITVTPAHQNTVIDLTGEDPDEEMRRALQMSMETDNGVGMQVQEEKQTFGPSTREPNPNWAVVPTNPQQQLSNEDENLKQAIEASLAGNENETLNMADMDVHGSEARFRFDLIWWDMFMLHCESQVIHALFHVPQIRERVARFRSPPDDQKTKEDKALETLVSLYTHLDYAALSTIDDNDVFELLNITPHDQIRPIHELCTPFVSDLAMLLEQYLPARESDGRLITFSAGRIEVLNGQARFDADGKPLTNVPLNVGLGVNEVYPNELVAHLSAMLNNYSPDGSSSHEGIQEPSDVIVFLLNHERDVNNAKRTQLGELEGFAYPKTMWMDQFLLENFEVAQEKREVRRRIRERVGELRKQRDGLTSFNNKDTIMDMKNSLYYYENVARPGPGEDLERLDSTTEKLRKMVVSLEAVIGNINAEIERLQNEDRTIFDCPELQKHQYDLRAVLMHTGVAGRKQMYSYVQDQDGQWWKTVDHLVTEATEADVLTDPTGLHLRAGPYMLIYSRTVSKEELCDPLPWPREIVDSVRRNNEQFLATLEPEMRDKYLASQKKEAVGKRPGGLERKPTVAVMELERPKETVQDVSMMDLTTSTATSTSTSTGGKA